MRIPARTSVVGVAVGLFAVVLTGCTIPGTTPPPSSGGPGTAPATASATPGQTETESAQQAGVDLTNLPAPIASATVAASVEGDPAAKLTINLHSLRRSGKVVTATVSFTVTSTETTGDNIFGYLGDHIWRPYLVDTTNLKRHDVLTGGGAAAKTDDVLSGTFAPGQTLYAYAMFAAPPQGVTTVDVQLLDRVPTAVSVPIT